MQAHGTHCVARSLQLAPEVSPGHTPRPIVTYANLPSAKRHILLRGNQGQARLFEQVAGAVGVAKVWTDHPFGNGGIADVVVRRQDDRRLLYEIEIEIASSAMSVACRTMGQSMKHGLRERD